MKKKKGFTLVELLVVIAIIGLLSTLAFISLNSARGKARDAKRISDVRSIQSALELHYNNQAVPSYPVAAVGTTGISAILTVSGTLPTAPLPKDGDDTVCTADQNLYTYTSWTSALHTGACATAPCGYYTISYCLGASTGGIAAGSHTACETGVACT